ncbi:TetR/AcrR family transcriptional regulator [Treponema sp.]|uniref:TetR/AcrR family transcriptional regulator n=1 Tax=Treponema sp. TaxID=166 RepID=UPI00257CD186|nr:TetR/AcrR family transcriptional regulator [Treponema sp.]MBE6355056.1 TetR/AcrR family transcriptional regulator [Treponema sp.]
MNENTETLRREILEGTIKVFNRKGLKFTMSEVAEELSKSKKTLYEVFPDKETMFFEMVDYCFDSIKKSEEEVFNNTSLSTIEKIRKILGVLPEGYKDIDFKQLYLLKDKFPKIYKKVEERLENGWEKTIQLLNKGMEEGVIRKVNILLFKMMMESSLEQFFQRDILVKAGISYVQGLEEIVNILVDGIIV